MCYEQPVAGRMAEDIDLSSMHSTESGGRAAQFCELCAAQGKKSKLQFFQINFEEAILMCPRKECVYPLGAKSSSSVVVNRNASDVANMKKRKRAAVAHPDKGPIQCDAAVNLAQGVTVNTASHALSVKRTARLGGTSARPAGNPTLPLQNISRNQDISTCGRESKYSPPDCAANSSTSLSGFKLSPTGASESPKVKQSPVTSSYSVLNPASPTITSSSSMNTAVKVSRACTPSASPSSMNTAVKVSRACTPSASPSTVTKTPLDLPSCTLHDNFLADATAPLLSVTDTYEGYTMNGQIHNTPVMDEVKDLNVARKMEKDYMPSHVFAQWKNKDALCWLDVALILLVHSKTLREVLDKVRHLHSAILLKKLVGSYDKACCTVQRADHLQNRLDQQTDERRLKLETSVGPISVKTGGGEPRDNISYLSIVPSLPSSEVPQSCETGNAALSSQGDEVTPTVLSVETLETEKRILDLRSSCRAVMDYVREKIWVYLQPKLRCQRGKNDSPVFALPLLVRECQAVQEAFLVHYQWEMTCSQCAHHHVDKVERTLPTFPAVPYDFSMDAPYFIRTCFRCSAPGQRVTMYISRLPRVLLVHFVEGLHRDPVSAYDFRSGGYRYSVTGVVQYRTSPDHFVAWLRDPRGEYCAESWMECDDLKNSDCSYSATPPSLPAAQVHIMMWERQQEADTIDALSKKTGSAAQPVPAAGLSISTRVDSQRVQSPPTGVSTATESNAGLRLPQKSSSSSLPDNKLTVPSSTGILNIPSLPVKVLPPALLSLHLVQGFGGQQVLNLGTPVLLSGSMPVAPPMSAATQSSAQSYPVKKKRRVHDKADAKPSGVQEERLARMKEKVQLMKIAQCGMWSTPAETPTTVAGVCAASKDTSSTTTTASSPSATMATVTVSLSDVSVSWSESKTLSSKGHLPNASQGSKPSKVATANVSQCSRSVNDVTPSAYQGSRSMKDVAAYEGSRSMKDVTASAYQGSRSVKDVTVSANQGSRSMKDATLGLSQGSTSVKDATVSPSHGSRSSSDEVASSIQGSGSSMSYLSALMPYLRRQKAMPGAASADTAVSSSAEDMDTGLLNDDETFQGYVPKAIAKVPASKGRAGKIGKHKMVSASKSLTAFPPRKRLQDQTGSTASVAIKSRVRLSNGLDSPACRTLTATDSTAAAPKPAHRVTMEANTSSGSPAPRQTQSATADKLPSALDPLFGSPVRSAVMTKKVLSPQVASKRVQFAIGEQPQASVPACSRLQEDPVAVNNFLPAKVDHGNFAEVLDELCRKLDVPSQLKSLAPSLLDR